MRVNEFAAPSDFSGNTGVVGQNVDEQMVDALGVPVAAHDYKAANVRLDSVKELISSLSPDQAKSIYERVAAHKRGDELSELFNTRFTTTQTKSLKELLIRQFSDPSALETPDKQQPDSARSEKRAEVEFTGM